jgi:hypothetical protein
LEIVKDTKKNGKFYIAGVHQLISLAKVQFRRGFSITFQFKSGLVKSYRTQEAAACCECLEQQMKQTGMEVSGVVAAAVIVVVVIVIAIAIIVSAIYHSKCNS